MSPDSTWTTRPLSARWWKVSGLVVVVGGSFFLPPLLDWPMWAGLPIALVLGVTWHTALCLRRCPECRRRMKVRIEKNGCYRLYHDCAACRITWDPRVEWSDSN